jgi:hypothetical protein
LLVCALLIFGFFGAGARILLFVIILCNALEDKNYAAASCVESNYYREFDLLTLFFFFS